MKAIKILSTSLLALCLLFVSVVTLADGHISQADVDRKIGEAEQRLQVVRNLGHEWTTTAPLIKNAKAAAKDNKFVEAYRLAEKANNQAKASFQQAVDTNQYWVLNIPK